MNGKFDKGERSRVRGWLKKIGSHIRSNTIVYLVLLLLPGWIWKHFYIESRTVYDMGFELAANIVWELIFVGLIIVLIDRKAQIREESARRPVHRSALKDVFSIFGYIHRLISDIVEESTSSDQSNYVVLNKYKLDENNKESKIPWEQHLKDEIKNISIEIENYMQRYNAFLASNDTGDSGSQLLHGLSSISRILKRIDRNLERQESDCEIKLELSFQNDVIFLIVNDLEVKLGTLQIFEDPINRVREYYKHAQMNAREEIPCFGDDDITMGQRDVPDISGKLSDMRRKKSWPEIPESGTGEFLEKARRRLDELLAGREGPGDWGPEPEHGGSTHVAGFRVAWCNLGIGDLEKNAAGDPDSPDEETARRLIQKAAEAGNVVAMRTLGLLYRDGLFAERSKAEKHIREAAERGDAEAQVTLGVMYRKGDILEQNSELAVKEFEKAEDQGNIEASINIAEMLYQEARDDNWTMRMYEARKKCSVAYGSAREAYDRADKAHDSAEKARLRKLLARASYQMGNIEHHLFEDRWKDPPEEEEVPEEELKSSMKECMDHYEFAETLGHDAARYELGRIWLRGVYVSGVHVNEFEAVSQDDGKAAYWLRKVVESREDPVDTVSDDGGHADIQRSAQIELGKMFVESRLPEEQRRAVLEWLAGEVKKGVWLTADAGRDASYVLASIYRQGICHGGRHIVPRNDVEAMKLLRSAAEKGYVEGQNGLGLMYRDGYVDCSGANVRKLDEAMKWFERAVENRNERAEWEWVVGAARNNLGEMYDRGQGDLPCEREPNAGIHTEKFVKYAEYEGDWHSEGEFWVVPGDCGNEFLLGVMYRDGRGGRRWDANKALQCFQNAALVKQFTLGEDDVIFGRIRWMEDHNEFDVGLVPIEDLVDWCHENNREVTRAESAWPVAEYCIGRMYEEDRCKKNVDRERALKWWRLAALPHGSGKPGYAGAQYKVGRRYEDNENPAEAEKWYLKAAGVQRDGGRGHCRAQYRLARLYEKGWAGREPNPDHAEEWYLKAAEPRWYDEQGHADAQYRLGCMYAEGWDCQEPDPDQAQDWYLKAARQRKAGKGREDGGWPGGGHPDAQYRLGRMYEEGWGGRNADLEEAEKWYLEAAQERKDCRWPGHPDAQYRLGRMYEEEQGGLSADRKKAKEWYLKAAKEREHDGGPGHPGAQYRLGRMYEESGWGGRNADLKEAEKWYIEAARERQEGGWPGHPGAQYRLGSMYEKGWEGGERDPVKARDHRLRAADSGQMEALQWAVKLDDAKPRHEYLLGCMYENGWKNRKPNLDEAEKLYLKAAGKAGKAGKGSADAQYRLGCMYEKEWDGREPNLDEAVKWYRKAAEARDDYKGHADAQYRLGGLHERKSMYTFDFDYNEAWELYRKAAERRRNKPGNAEAQYRLAKLKEDVRTEHQWRSEVEWYLSKEEVDCYRQAAMQGHVEAQYELGAAYRSGWIGTGKDDEAILGPMPQNETDEQTEWCGKWLKRTHNADKAAKWYRKAACEGNAGAQFELGRMYESGWNDRGPDLDEAVKW